MKLLSALLLTTALCAQNVDKVTVPLDDPSRPAQIHANLMNGGITVRGSDRKDVLVESHDAESHDGESHDTEAHPPRPRADGMKRLDSSGGSSDITEENNIVTIGNSPFGNGRSFILSVPRHSSLRLKCMNGGDILVENVDGELDLDNLNGRVTAHNVSGSILAHSLNGDVTVTTNRLDPGKPASFSTMNGKIDVTLPASTRANVRMKTDNGEIYSDFEVALEAGKIQLEPSNKNGGKFHVRLDHALRGTINGGGPEYQFTSFNGEIFIRKGK